MMKRIWLFVLALAMTVAVTASASTGTVNLKGLGTDRGTYSFGVTPNSWLYMPGGFWVTLDGGHRFFYKKTSDTRVTFTYQKKSVTGHFTEYKASAPLSFVQYTVSGSNRQLTILQDAQLNTITAANGYMQAVMLKAGSVINK